MEKNSYVDAPRLHLSTHDLLLRGEKNHGSDVLMTLGSRNNGHLGYDKADDKTLY